MKAKTLIKFVLTLTAILWVCNLPIVRHNLPVNKTIVVSTLVILTFAPFVYRKVKKYL